MLLVAFTGQGSSADGKAYLLPKDAITGGGASLLASTSIDFDVDIKQRLVARRMKQLVLLVDSTVGGSSSLRGRAPAEPRFRPGGDGRGPAARWKRVAVVHATSVGLELVRRSRRAAVALHPRPRGGRARRGGPRLRRMDHAGRRCCATCRRSSPSGRRGIDASFRQEPTVAVDGFLPNEIRFARVAARTASSSGDLRCALRAPGSSARRPVRLRRRAPRRLAHRDRGRGRPRRERRGARDAVRPPGPARPARASGRSAAPRPARRCSPSRRRTSASARPTSRPRPCSSPVYRVRWQATNAEGIPYKEVFKHPTENRQGRTDVVAAGTEHPAGPRGADHAGRVLLRRRFLRLELSPRAGPRLRGRRDRQGAARTRSPGGGAGKATRRWTPTPRTTRCPSGSASRAAPSPAFGVQALERGPTHSFTPADSALRRASLESDVDVRDPRAVPAPGTTDKSQEPHRMSRSLLIGAGVTALLTAAAMRARPRRGDQHAEPPAAEMDRPLRRGAARSTR